jgi:hypothetical protein
MDAFHFYVDTFALAVSVVGLIPIYKDIGRKYFAISLAIVLVCVFGVSVWMFSQHARQIATTEKHILAALESDPKTFDELAQGMDYSETQLTSEALADLRSEPGSLVKFDDIDLKNWDGSIKAKIRRYYLQK